MNLEQIKKLSRDIKILAMKAGSFGRTFDDLEKIVEFELTSLQAEHEREMGELVQEILDEQSTYDNYNNTKCYQAVSVEAIKAIATRRGLLKVTGGEK